MAVVKQRLFYQANLRHRLINLANELIYVDIDRKSESPRPELHMEKKESVSAPANALGAYLVRLRTAKELTLRQVEEATSKEVSNAYLSQLEHGQIAKPSPNILYSLANVYGASYETLMEKAGYIAAVHSRKPGQKHGRAATFAIADLTPEEEEELLSYLAYIRKRKRGKT